MKGKIRTRICPKNRTRYFTDSGVIGSKEFVAIDGQRLTHLILHKIRFLRGDLVGLGAGIKGCINRIGRHHFHNPVQGTQNHQLFPLFCL